MAKLIETFWDDEAGSGTVDWLILAAGVLMLGVAVTAAILPAPATLAADEQTGVLKIDEA